MKFRLAKKIIAGNRWPWIIDYYLGGLHSDPYNLIERARTTYFHHVKRGKKKRSKNEYKF